MTLERRWRIALILLPFVLILGVVAFRWYAQARRTDALSALEARGEPTRLDELVVGGREGRSVQAWILELCNVSVANAYLADVTTEAERSRDFGRLGMSSSLGFILGPVLASLFGALGDGEALSIYAALVISLVALVAIARLLPETRAHAGPRPSRKGLARTAGCEPVDCTHVPETRRVGRILVLYFLIFLGFSFFYVAFPVRASGELGWSVGRTGLFFTVLSGLMVLTFVLAGALLVVVAILASRWCRARSEPEPEPEPELGAEMPAVGT